MSGAESCLDQGPPPKYMGHLVDRAAAMLLARWPCTQCEFSMWQAGVDVDGGGEYLPFLARLQWGFGDRAPGVLVFDGRSGDYVCRSQVGRWDEIDPTCWVLDVPQDEVERYEWERGQHSRQEEAKRFLAGLGRGKGPAKS